MHELNTHVIGYWSSLELLKRVSGNLYTSWKDPCPAWVLMHSIGLGLDHIVVDKSSGLETASPPHPALRVGPFLITETSSQTWTRIYPPPNYAFFFGRCWYHPSFMWSLPRPTGFSFLRFHIFQGLNWPHAHVCTSSITMLSYTVGIPSRLLSCTGNMVCDLDSLGTHRSTS